MRRFFEGAKGTGILSRTVADVSQGMAENYYNDNGEFARKKVKRQFEKFLKEQLRANIFEAGYYSLAESLYPIFLPV